jgi:phage gpG-like protein
MFGVSIEGDAALAVRLDRAPAAIRAAMLAKAAQLAEALRAHVVRDKLSGQVLQARTGALRDSIEAEAVEERDRLLLRLYSNGSVKYAAIQEYGGHTSAHQIVPRKARALAFVAGGRRVFARIVRHPGSAIPARHYLASAVADMAPQIIAGLTAAAAGLGD